jgi:hypothetical protein
MNTHGPLLTNTLLWLTMLSPLIILIVSLLGAWVTQLNG